MRSQQQPSTREATQQTQSQQSQQSLQPSRTHSVTTSSSQSTSKKPMSASTTRIHPSEVNRILSRQGKPAASPAKKLQASQQQETQQVAKDKVKKQFSILVPEISPQVQPRRQVITAQSSPKNSVEQNTIFIGFPANVSPKHLSSQSIQTIRTVPSSSQSPKQSVNGSLSLKLQLQKHLQPVQSHHPQQQSYPATPHPYHSRSFNKFKDLFGQKRLSGDPSAIKPESSQPLLGVKQHQSTVPSPSGSTNKPTIHLNLSKYLLIHDATNQIEADELQKLSLQKKYLQAELEAVNMKINEILEKHISESHFVESPVIASNLTRNIENKKSGG